MTKVSASLLSANFAALRDDIDMLNATNVDMLHLDVMDGVFVPNITFGFPVIRDIRSCTDKILDAHLMIVDPGRYVSQIRDCGVEYMTVHYEACTHLNRVVQQIKQAGMKAGVALNPATPVSMLDDIIEDVDMVLVMSVNPGFAAQKFLPVATRKIAQVKDLIQTRGCHAEIEVDGGINMLTGAEVVNAGADILVSGNYIFKADSPARTIKALSNL